MIPTLPPAVDDVRQLSVQRDGWVTTDSVNASGSLHPDKYLAISSSGMVRRLGAIGLPTGQPPSSGFSAFTREHHLVRWSDLRHRDRYTVHTRLIDRSDSAFHAMAFVLDATNERLAFTSEILSICVDLSTRSPAPFPDHVRRRMDMVIRQDTSLTWAIPTCGTIAIRRRRAAPGDPGRGSQPFSVDDVRL